MRRIVVCTLIALASAGAIARESKLSDAGGSCPGNESRTVAARGAARDAVATPVPPNKAKSAPQGGGGGDARMQSPRWHRFLPGMFR